MMSSQRGTVSLGVIRSANFSTGSTSRRSSDYSNTLVGPNVTIFQGHNTYIRIYVVYVAVYLEQGMVEVSKFQNFLVFVRLRVRFCT
jgi:hypothetical protein